MCICFACSLILTGFLWETPAGILRGLLTYIGSRAVLLSDYFALGTPGAAFVNAGLVTFLSIGLTLLIKTPYTGTTVAALFLMPGFAMFGKNPVNILPFFLGVFLYARFRRVPMANYTTAALYSTTLAPVVSHFLCQNELPPVLRVLLAAAAGTLLGFTIVPIAEHLFQLHRGYMLFNFGFSSGLLAYLFASIFRTLHLPVALESHWHAGVNNAVLAYLFALCAVLVLAGFWLSGWKFRQYHKIMRHHGHAHSDQIATDGIGSTMVNMGFVGLICIGYILLIGGDLSGPVVGAILTAIGFSASCIHPRNTIPIMLGVWLYSLVAASNATTPAIQIAAIFGATALAPIAGEFGPILGILAGAMHFAIVSSTGTATGGFNLYNNGFAAGLVAALLITLLHAFFPRFDIVTQRRLLHMLLLKKKEKSQPEHPEKQQAETVLPEQDPPAEDMPADTPAEEAYRMEA